MQDLIQTVSMSKNILKLLRYLSKIYKKFIVFDTNKIELFIPMSIPWLESHGI